jgi:hypothetical protein
MRFAISTHKLRASPGKYSLAIGAIDRTSRGTNVCIITERYSLSLAVQGRRSLLPRTRSALYKSTLVRNDFGYNDNGGLTRKRMGPWLPNRSPFDAYSLATIDPQIGKSTYFGTSATMSDGTETFFMIFSTRDFAGRGPSTWPSAFLQIPS